MGWSMDLGSFSSIQGIGNAWPPLPPRAFERSSAVASFSNQECCVVSKTGLIHFERLVKRSTGFIFLSGGRGQDGVRAAGREAQHHLGARRTLNAEALGAAGPAAIGANLEGRADAPNLRPPGATRGGAPDGPLFLLGQIPGFVRGQPQVALGFVDVAMESQLVDVRGSGCDLGQWFAGERGGQTTLPEWMRALAFPFGLRRWRIKKAAVVERERPAEWRQRGGSWREQEGVIIDVDLQRSSAEENSGGEEIEAGQEEFSTLEFGSDEATAALVTPMAHGKVQRASGEPAMGRSVHLPECAARGALPAPPGGGRAFGSE